MTVQTAFAIALVAGFGTAQYILAYQSLRDLARRRLAVTIDDYATTRTNSGYGGVFTAARAGLQYSPTRKVDLGASIGFDDLSKLGSFAPSGYLALRI